MRLDLLAAAAMLTVLAAGPALAHEDHGHGRAEHAAPYVPYEDTGEHRFDSPSRDAWLADCRQRLSARDSSAGGAVIGGVAGGIAGNRIAGRGNRIVGTAVGAAAGAAVGAAIDQAGDARRNRDACEAYLDDYYARYSQVGYYQPYGYPQGYGYAAPAYGCCMAPQPAMMVPVTAEAQCTETVEYVYEDVPARPASRKRYIPRRSKAVPDKRVPVS